MVRPSRAAFVLFAASPLGPHALRSLKQPPQDSLAGLSGEAEGLSVSKAEIRQVQARYCSGASDKAGFDACMEVAQGQGSNQSGKTICEAYFRQYIDKAFVTTNECTLQRLWGEKMTDGSWKDHEDCPMKKMKAKASYMVYLPPPAKCLTDHHQPAFQVIPGSKNQVLLSFGRAGVCPDMKSMAAGLCCDKSMPVEQIGILGNHPDNPYKDFTKVIYLGCNGDMGMGSARHKFKLPGTPGNIQQMGELHVLEMLQWVKENMGEDVDEVVGTAHGDGVVTLTLWLKEIFTTHYFKKWSIGKVLLDGALPLPKGSFATMLGKFETNDAFFNGDLQALYHSGYLTTTDVLKSHLKDIPGVLVQAMTSKFDSHAMGMYNVAYHWLHHTELNDHTWDPYMIKPGEWYILTIEDFQSFEDENWNFCSFFIDGDSSNHLVHADLWGIHGSGYGKMPAGDTSLVDWLKTGAGEGCIKIPNVCYGPRKAYTDVTDLVTDIKFCDPWLDSFEIVFNCPGEDVKPHKLKKLPTVKRAASTTPVMEYPYWLFTTPSPNISTKNSTEMEAEELNVSSSHQ